MTAGNAQGLTAKNERRIFHTLSITTPTTSTTPARPGPLRVEPCGCLGGERCLLRTMMHTPTARHRRRPRNGRCRRRAAMESALCHTRHPDSVATSARRANHRPPLPRCRGRSSTSTSHMWRRSGTGEVAVAGLERQAGALAREIWAIRESMRRQPAKGAQPRLRLVRRPRPRMAWFQARNQPHHRVKGSRARLPLGPHPPLLIGRPPRLAAVAIPAAHSMRLRNRNLSKPGGHLQQGRR